MQNIIFPYMKDLEEKKNRVWFSTKIFACVDAFNRKTAGGGGQFDPPLWFFENCIF